MFFPRGWFTPVLPPTLESTWDMTVVGTCTQVWMMRGVWEKGSAGQS